MKVKLTKALSVLFVTLALILCAFASCAELRFPCNGTVNKPDVNVRKEASSKSNLVCQLDKNDVVTILSEEQNGNTVWYHVEYGKGKKGYIRGDLLNIEVINSDDTTNSSEWSAAAVYEKYLKDLLSTSRGEEKTTSTNHTATGNILDFDQTSDTQLNYNYAVNMSKNTDRLVMVDDKYIYGGYVIDNMYLGGGIEIEEELVDYWYGKVYLSQGTLYETMAMTVEKVLKNGKSAYKSVDNSVFKRIFGIEKPIEYKNGIQYFKNVSGLLKSKDGSKGIFDSFDKATTIKGYFDFENRNCNFTIPNVKDTAKELGISETMLGYILAVFDTYAADVTFNGNSCTVIREK